MKLKYCQAQIEGRKACSHQCQHCNKYYQFIESGIEEGDIVIETKYGISGIVSSVFENWDDLKNKSDFLTFDPDNEAKESDMVELLINGDPRDGWLYEQKIPFTADQLLEPWYSVKCFDGGSIWTCHSCLKKSPQQQ